METKINVAKILKDKPKGTKLYSSACGKCELKEADDKSFKVSFHSLKSGFMIGGEGTFDKNGNLYDDGECVVFPSKEMRDWSKFAWKRGDVLISDCGFVCIFKEWASDDYTRFNGCYFDGMPNAETAKYSKLDNNTAYGYIREIENRCGGKLNLETLRIEKSEFKDGDIIKMTWDKYSAIVIFWEYSNFGKGFDSHVFFNIKTKIIEYNIHGHTLQDVILRLATEDEKKQLFSALEKEGKAWDVDKKKVVSLKPNVDELKPFDKVLVRDSKSNEWRANLFSYKNVNEPYCCVYASWNYCIPYEGNEHLLGTKNNPK